MNSVKMFDRFQFHDNPVLDHQVEAMRPERSVPIVQDDWHLPLELQACSLEFN